MIAIARIPRKREQEAHNQFVAMLPQIEKQAHFAFRHQRMEARAEFVAEVIANAYVAYNRLTQLGRQDIAYATPLASYAIRQVRLGRRVGTQQNSGDVTSPLAPGARGIRFERLDRFDAKNGEWRESLVEDRRAGPADTAAARLDIASWFRAMSIRDRRIALALANGESTSATARRFKLSPARISQLRQQLRSSWQAMQGEPLTV